MGKVRQSNQPKPAHSPSYRFGHEGIAFVATLRGTPGRDVVDTALDALRNLHHGQSRSSGILTHIPDRLLRSELGGDLPPAGGYAVGFAFLTKIGADQRAVASAAAAEGFAVLTWRPVPLNDTIVDIDPRASMPAMYQVLLLPGGDERPAPGDFDAGLYRLRKRAQDHGVYFASLSRTTVVYKALVPATHLAMFYTDLADPQYRTEIAIVHSCHRGAHDWADAQPHRVLAHDGSIHSATANRTWLRARAPLMTSDVLPGGGAAFPDGLTTEAHLDEYVELLHRSGRSLAHALRMVIPEQWEHTMSEAERNFYAYSATVVEPWEGSGATCFADGYLVGAVLDRHGTRSGRYWVTETGLVIFASETGVVDLDPSTVTKKGRLAPGELIAVDTVVGNVLPSGAVAAQLAALHPYGQWLQEHLTQLGSDHEPAATGPEQIDPAYDVTDASLARADALARGVLPADDLSVSGQISFFDRFHSRRPGLTTPHLDAVSAPSPGPVLIGPEHDILTDGPQHAQKVAFPSPVLTPTDLDQLRRHLPVAVISGVYARGSLEAALERVRADVAAAVGEQAAVLVVSNRGAVSPNTLPIPSLLLAATAHQFLLRAGHRAQVSVIVEAGDALEPVHVLRLLAAGACAVVPYHGIARAGTRAGTYLEGLRQALDADMLAGGVAEYRAYQGGQSFHIVGLAREVVKEFFPSARHALGRLTLAELGEQLGAGQPDLQPIHTLLHLTSNPIEVTEVEAAQRLEERFLIADPLEVTDAREQVDVHALAGATDILLSPPPHHDITGPHGLEHLVSELRKVNPTARVHARVGADLTSAAAAADAVAAGVDVINLVDGVYQWVLGLITITRNLAPDSATIAVGTALNNAHEVLIAGVLGAREVRLREDLDPRAVAADLRHLLAEAGVRRFADVIGRADLLDWSEAIEHWGQAGVNLTALHQGGGHEQAGAAPAQRGDEEAESFDDSLIDLAAPALQDARPVRVHAYVTNTDSSVGVRLAGEVARRHGPDGLPENTIRITLTGSTGASLGAFLPAGMTVTVQGEAGDFVGKGLSGGRIIVRPEVTASFSPQVNVIAGSAIGYGASSGSVYLSGVVGERLGAHNRGGTIVCEGAGEGAGYRMQCGTLLILGETGVNLGAGLNGGAVYVLDFDETTLHRPGVAAGELEAAPVSEVDVRVITALLAEHAEVTRSRIATTLLADPDRLLRGFTKIQRPGRTNPEANCAHNGTGNVWDRVLRATGPARQSTW